MNNIKFTCSCTRNIEFSKRNFNTVNVNTNPKAGDIVVVKVIDDRYGYTIVEDYHGRCVDILNGDIFIAILGDRNSGTNVVAYPSIM